MIQPHFEHCGSVSDGLSIHSRAKKKKLQNPTVRGILQTNYELSSSFLLEILKRDRVTVGLAPLNLWELFSDGSTDYVKHNYFGKLTLPTTAH